MARRDAFAEWRSVKWIGFPIRFTKCCTAFAPARALTDATLQAMRKPFHLFANTSLARNISASAELFERVTRRYGKPAFGFPVTVIGDETSANR